MPRIAERMKIFQKLPAERRISGNRPRLDKRQPLPGLPAARIMIFHSGKRTDKRPLRPFRTEPKIDAKQKSMLRLLLQRMREHFRNFLKKPPRLHFSRFPLLPAKTVAFVEVNQIDIGRKIQLAPAEFSECQNTKTSALILQIIPRLAIMLLPMITCSRITLADTKLRKRRKIPHRFLTRMNSVNVTPGDPHRHPAAKPTEHRQEMTRIAGNISMKPIPFIENLLSARLLPFQRLLKQPGKIVRMIEQKLPIKRRQARKSIESNFIFRRKRINRARNLRIT